MKEISIIHKQRSKKATEAADFIAEFLLNNDCSVYVAENSSQNIFSEKIPEERLVDKDIMLTIGGDGTFLHASSLMKTKSIPMMGINMGSLGFLTPFFVSDTKTNLLKFFQNQLKIVERMRFQVNLSRDDKIIFTSIAANDVVVNYGRLARLMEINCYIDNDFVSTYKADGLILSTPMGSTAYALAAGGPILLPGMNACSIVPICSHQLTQRPIVISADSEITIKIAKPGYITVDGQQGISMKTKDTLTIKRSPLSLQVIQPPNYSFFNVLKHKLSLGAREAKDA